MNSDEHVGKSSCRTTKLPALWAFAVGTVLSAAGCGSAQPAMSVGNLKYLQMLRTAVSSQDAEKVRKVLAAAEQQQQQGALSTPEFEALSEIGGQATAGEWKAAEQACVRLEEGQQWRHRD